MNLAIFNLELVRTSGFRTPFTIGILPLIALATELDWLQLVIFTRNLAL